MISHHIFILYNIHKILNENFRRVGFINPCYSQMRLISILLIVFDCLITNMDLKQRILNSNYIKNRSIQSLSSNIIVWGVHFGCVNHNIDQGRSYTQSNINISNCFFSRSSAFADDGGVIHVSGGSFSMNVSITMFYNCLAKNGGAIYFSSSNSFLNMICVKSCSTISNSYHFAIICASGANHMDYISISNCSHDTLGYYTLWLQGGNERFDNTNSSMNNANQVSGILIDIPTSFSSSHCTFSNNKVSYARCLYISSTSGSISISSANIIHNISPNIGVFYVSGAGLKKVMYCILLNNQNVLFYLHSGSLEVSHSYISHTGVFSTSTSVSTTNNNSFTSSNTYQIQFFYSLHCNTDIPLPKGTIDQTNHETPKNSIPRSYAEIICSNQMENIREINVMFTLIFAFCVH